MVRVILERVRWSAVGGQGRCKAGWLAILAWHRLGSLAMLWGGVQILWRPYVQHELLCGDVRVRPFSVCVSIAAVGSSPDMRDCLLGGSQPAAGCVTTSVVVAAELARHCTCAVSLYGSVGWCSCVHVRVCSSLVLGRKGNTETSGSTSSLWVLGGITCSHCVASA